MKFNHPAILTALFVVSLLPVQVTSAKGKPPPPPPEPASDVVCDGCVDTTDIAEGAVRQSVGVFVNDVRVGTYLETMNTEGYNRETGKFISDVNILLDSGYLTTVLGSGGVYSDLVFYNIDCTSQAYLRISEGRLGSISNNNGFVFEARGTGELFYIPRGATEESIVYTSRNIDGVCVFDSINNTTGYKVFPNDKNITGVDSSDFIGDVRLGF